MTNNPESTDKRWNADSIALRAEIDRKRMEAHDNEYKRRHDDMDALIKRYGLDHARKLTGEVE